MISWDRHGDRFVLTFSPRQITWLRRHLTRYQEALDQPKFADDRRGSIARVIEALPDRGGQVIVEESECLTWAWVLQDLRQDVVNRLNNSSADRTIVVRAAAGLQSWLDEMIARLTVDVMFSEVDQQQFHDLIRDADRRQN